MNNPLTFNTLKKMILKILLEESDFIYLLGSAATERFHSESDVDIAVYWKKVPEWSQFLNYKSQLESSVGYDVDLITLNTSDPIFSRQILETGRILFVDENSKGLLLKWQSEKMSEYPDFKYSRKIIEDHLLTRKKYV